MYKLKKTSNYKSRTIDPTLIPPSYLFLKCLSWYLSITKTNLVLMISPHLNIAVRCVNVFVCACWAYFQSKGEV